MKSFVRQAACAAFVGAAIFGTAVTAVAQAPAEIAQRQEVMKANGGAMRVLAPIVRGEAPWNAHFPAGTGPDKGQTAALPAIWERKAEFDAIFDRQVAAASNLVTLAAANDEAGFKAGFAALGQTCGACHTPFRRPAN
jgi:cytochrome c556